jgi:restriction system protein
MTDPLIPPHGGYRDLKSYQMAEIIFDGTVVFCDRFTDKRSRIGAMLAPIEGKAPVALPLEGATRAPVIAQMVQAARSGKQNIAEGSMASGTSKKTDLKLIGVARASLEELLLDFQDFLRQKGLPLWDKNHAKAKKIRALAYKSNRSYSTSKSYFEEAEAAAAANAAICLIHQANYLLDQQLRTLGKEFVEEGGFTERLHRVRTQARGPWKKA